MKENTLDRNTMVRERLEMFVMNDLHAAIAMPEPAAWEGLAIPIKYKTQGWLYPLPYTRPEDQGETLMITVCVETIVEHTRWLTDDELSSYLSAIEMFMGVHVAHYPLTEDDPEGIPLAADRERLAEDKLYDVNPDALNLVTEVQMRAMDTVTE